jgi:hypothetical protein
LTDPKTVSYLDVLAQIHELMRGKRDYIYPATIKDGKRACQYWHEDDNGPGCIVGVWGYSLGLTASNLLSCEGYSSIGVLERLERAGYIFESRPYTVLFLQRLQFAQDSGATWGFAYDNAWDLVDRQQQIDRLKAN